MAAGFNLLGEFNKGNKKAFTTIYTDCYPAVFYVANKYLTDKEDALDITAETFVKLWQSRKEFQSLDHIRNFLYTVARNAAINYLKKLDRKTATEKELLYLQESAWSPDHQAIEVEAEACEMIYKAIEELPGKCRDIFKLLIIGQSTEEIANRFNISVKTVRSQKARALELLRNQHLKKLVIAIMLSVSLLYFIKKYHVRAPIFSLLLF